MAYIREYQLSDETLRVIPLSLGGLQRAQAEWTKRHAAPVVPMVKSVIVEQEVEEPNPDDPAYVETLAIWRNELNSQILKYAFSTCVLNRPPAEFIESQRAYFEDTPLSLPDLMYMWLTSLAQTETDITELSEFIMGSALATEKGIAAAENTFQGTGGLSADSAVPPAEEG